MINSKTIILVFILLTLLDLHSTSIFIPKLGWESEGNIIAEWIFQHYGIGLTSYTLIVLTIKLPFLLFIIAVLWCSRYSFMGRSLASFMLYGIYFALTTTAIVNNYFVGLNYELFIHDDFSVNSIVFAEPNGFQHWFLTRIAGWIFWWGVPLTLANVKDDGSVKYGKIFIILILGSFSTVLLTSILV